MNIIDRYLAQTILHAIGVVLIAAIGLEFFIMLVAELHDIGHEHYGIGSALWYVVLNLPEQIYQIFPMAGLIGMLMGLGLLANHSELIVLRQAGLSFIAITARAFKTLITLVLLLAIVGEVIAPKASAYADQYKDQALHGKDHPAALGRDVWVKDQHSFLHIGAIDQQQALHNISWYEFDPHRQLKQFSFAATGYYHHGAWHVSDIKSTIVQGTSVHVTRQDEAVWPFNLAPNVLRNSVQKPSSLSLRELNASLRFHQTAHTSNDPLQLAFWKRLLQPLASLVMMLLAVPFIFGPLRSVSQSLRLVAGIAAGFGFYYCNQLLTPLILILQLPPILGASLPSMLFGVIGIWMLLYQRH